MRLEITMDDSPGVAVVESIAELVEEELHLIAAHRLLVLTHVLLQVVVHQLKHKVQLLFSRDVDDFAETAWGMGYWTILGWG